ncbi:uncharacterized protein LOC130134368 [Syzygium oleosum]|uniref:uncharacterized protein LOC130134368 n=1 Tax=Syzygium oleosum TaxID=219896 RepID=UPI0011D213EC|nr:uncharacterized protein LOC130134368 [Syzygium oleosum]
MSEVPDAPTDVDVALALTDVEAAGAAAAAAERAIKRQRQMQSTGGEAGETQPRVILSEGLDYLKHLNTLKDIVRTENHTLIRRSLSDARLAIDEMQEKLKLNRHCFLAALERSYEKCEQKLTEEKANLDQLFEELVKCKASHDQAFNDALSKLKAESERLVEQYDHSRQSAESLALSFAGQIDKLEESLNKRDQDDNVSAKMVVEASKLVPWLRAQPSTMS